MHYIRGTTRSSKCSWLADLKSSSVKTSVGCHNKAVKWVGEMLTTPAVPENTCFYILTYEFQTS